MFPRRIFTDEPPSEEDELAFKRKSLKYAVMCIGFLKLTSIVCFLILYFFVRVHSRGDISLAIQIMLLVIIPAQTVHGCILFYGALEEKIGLLALGLWMSLLLAAINTVLGTMGCIFFLRTGHMTVHFLLAVCFSCLICSFFGVICHDIIIIYTFKQVLKEDREENMMNVFDNTSRKV